MFTSETKHNHEMHDDIRERFEAGEIQSHLSKIYGITPSVINKIVRNKFTVQTRELSSNEKLLNFLLKRTEFIGRRKVKRIKSHS